MLENAAVEPTVDASGPTASDLAEHFPQYEIQHKIGEGGMGVVYRARHTKLDRLVALKVLRPELATLPELEERFLREAQALASLDHEGIVRVHDFGEAGGFFFLAMEYVDGASLREVMASGAMSSKEVLALVPKLCAALEYAHGQGVVHRDVKPENLLIDADGRVKIADFGLAKITSHDGTAMTRTQQAMGTPHYMAPEQIAGTRDVDHRADLYSLGVVLYELLTGELPLGRFAPPSEKSDAGERWDPVVMKSLEPDPSERYQSASELEASLATAPQPEKGRPIEAKKPAKESVQEEDPSDFKVQAVWLAAIFFFSWLPWVATDRGVAANGWEAQSMLFDAEMPIWIVHLCALAIALLPELRKRGYDGFPKLIDWGALALGTIVTVHTAWFGWIGHPIASQVPDPLHRELLSMMSDSLGSSFVFAWGATLTFLAFCFAAFVMVGEHRFQQRTAQAKTKSHHSSAANPATQEPEVEGEALATTGHEAGWMLAMFAVSFLPWMATDSGFRADAWNSTSPLFGWYTPVWFALASSTLVVLLPAARRLGVKVPPFVESVVLVIGTLFVAHLTFLGWTAVPLENLGVYGPAYREFDEENLGVHLDVAWGASLAFLGFLAACWYHFSDFVAKPAEPKRRRRRDRAPRIGRSPGQHS